MFAFIRNNVQFVYLAVAIPCVIWIAYSINTAASLIR